MQLTATASVADETFLLDLLNSTPIVDGTQRDDLDTAQAGRAWLQERGHGGSVGEWRAARVARAILQDVVRTGRPTDRPTPGSERPPSVARSGKLAGLLEHVSYRAEVADDGVRWRLDAPADQVAATRAVLTWDAVQRTRPGRLRPCENDECALFLIDRSKPNKARWCSMATCGNRMKARRHYERTRTAAAE
jgi:predicted RNA-binding Zn ribbon-like protein